MPLYDDDNGAVNVILENVAVFAGPKGEKGDPGDPGDKGADGSGIQWTGDWTAGTYSQYDAVFHNGSSYIANTGTSQEPPGSDWDMLAQESTPNVTSVFGRTGVVTANTGDYTATKITNTPAGNISATNVQSALNELDTEKLAAATYTASDILTKIKTVDGSGSGLDADLLDGLSSSAFTLSSRSILNVKDYGAVGDGTTNDGSAIASAITAALALTPTAELFWPAGTYKTTSSLTNFHTVPHKGSGRILRSSDYFYIDPKYTQSNTIYVSSSGSTSNDGLSSSQPTTLSTSAGIIQRYSDRGLSGRWNVALAAGTYTDETFSLDSLTWTDYPVIVKGPVVDHPSTPTAIIDAGGLPSGTQVCNIDDGGWVEFQYVKVIGMDTGYGFSASLYSRMGLINCHTDDCLYGILNQHSSNVYISGGIFDGNGLANSYGYAGFYNATHSITSTSTETAAIFRDCETGLFVNEGTQGHLDYTVITDCDVGLWIARSGGANNTKSMTIYNNTIGVLADNQWFNNGIDFARGNPLFENTTDVVTRGNAPEYAYRNLNNNSKTLRVQDVKGASSAHTGTTAKTLLWSVDDIIQPWMLTSASNTGDIIELEAAFTSSLSSSFGNISLDLYDGTTTDVLTAVTAPVGTTDFVVRAIIYFNSHLSAICTMTMICSSGGTDQVDEGSNALNFANKTGDLKLYCTLGNSGDSVTLRWATCKTTLGG